MCHTHILWDIHMCSRQRVHFVFHKAQLFWQNPTFMYVLNMQFSMLLLQLWVLFSNNFHFQTFRSIHLIFNLKKIGNRNIKIFINNLEIKMYCKQRTIKRKSGVTLFNFQNSFPVFPVWRNMTLTKIYTSRATSSFKNLANF